MRRTMRVTKTLTISAMAIAAALTMAGCAGADDTAAPEVEQTEFEAGTTMAELQEAGEITIGTKYDQPLFGLVDADGTPQGFDVEMGKVETVSANREPFIESGEVDVVIATYTINDARKEIISFAGPYYEAGQDLLVLEGNPENIEGPEDLAGQPVCTVSGSTSEKNIAEYTTDIIAAGGYADCLEPLRTGAVVAVTTDNVILAGLADQNAPEFEVVNAPFTEEPYGIGLAKDDTEFRNFINDVLEEAYEDGSWAEAWENTAGVVLDTPEPPAVDRY
jgi:glutamate transport system substrate-binding protein